MSLDLPLDRIAALCREYGVIELDVFGSVARGEATEDSDIDFLYVLSDPSIGMRFFEFQRRLAEILGRDEDDVEFQRRLAEILGRDEDDVDLVPKLYLNRVIRDRVLAEAQTLHVEAA
jgi:predicted nucleotidyltransferase